MKKIHKLLAFLSQKYYHISESGFKRTNKLRISNMKNSEIKGVTQPKTKLGKSKMDKILKAARRLFSQNGFYQTSITDICRESNTAVGTFYIYFDDKTALYRCLMENVQREIKDTINEALLKKTAPLVWKRKRKVCALSSNTGRQIRTCLKFCGEA